MLISKKQLIVVQKNEKKFLKSPVTGIYILVSEWKEHSPLQFNYHLHPPGTTHHMSQKRRKKILIHEAKKNKNKKKNDCSILTTNATLRWLVCGCAKTSTVGSWVVVLRREWNWYWWTLHILSKVLQKDITWSL